jgi:hypothetical protein
VIQGEVGDDRFVGNRVIVLATPSVTPTLERVEGARCLSSHGQDGTKLSRISHGPSIAAFDHQLREVVDGPTMRTFENLRKLRAGLAL